ncbi:hypothetical protein ADUPG1_007750 [Aduncisulcus paluster]|uniref:Uncharacterized protein n=1 Tax=Aduncisulcus paluster TaxID=2918883 RepID=A0ABQ5KTQ9_9EUKA|nr:hypothetical protein ADUPG1_007750 [Aduncisulcus paluster]
MSALNFGDEKLVISLENHVIYCIKRYNLVFFVGQSRTSPVFKGYSFLSLLSTLIYFHLGPICGLSSEEYDLLIPRPSKPKSYYCDREEEYVMKEAQKIRQLIEIILNLYGCVLFETHYQFHPSFSKQEMEDLIKKSEEELIGENNDIHPSVSSPEAIDPASTASPSSRWEKSTPSVVLSGRQKFEERMKRRKRIAATVAAHMRAKETEKQKGTLFSNPSDPLLPLISTYSHSFTPLLPLLPIQPTFSSVFMEANRFLFSFSSSCNLFASVLSVGGSVVCSHSSIELAHCILLLENSLLRKRNSMTSEEDHTKKYENGCEHTIRKCFIPPLTYEYPDPSAIKQERRARGMNTTSDHVDAVPLYDDGSSVTSWEESYPPRAPLPLCPSASVVYLHSVRHESSLVLSFISSSRDPCPIPFKPLSLLSSSISQALYYSLLINTPQCAEILKLKGMARPESKVDILPDCGFPSIKTQRVTTAEDIKAEFKSSIESEQSEDLPILSLPLLSSLANPLYYTPRSGMCAARVERGWMMYDLYEKGCLDCLDSHHGACALNSVEESYMPKECLTPSLLPSSTTTSSAVMQSTAKALDPTTSQGACVTIFHSTSARIKEASVSSLPSLILEPHIQHNTHAHRLLAPMIQTLSQSPTSIAITVAFSPGSPKAGHRGKKSLKKFVDKLKDNGGFLSAEKEDCNPIFEVSKDDPFIETVSCHDKSDRKFLQPIVEFELNRKDIPTRGNNPNHNPSFALDCSLCSLQHSLASEIGIRIMENVFGTRSLFGEGIYDEVIISTPDITHMLRVFDTSTACVSIGTKSYVLNAESLRACLRAGVWLWKDLCQEDII